jgi:putative membrane protein
MSAGLFILAAFLNCDTSKARNYGWSSAFLIVGLIAGLFGAHLCVVWPLPGSFNIAFGEASVLFGALFLGASLSVAAGSGLKPLGIYSIFAGLAAILIGIRLYNLNLTNIPELTMIGFVLTGLGGILILPSLCAEYGKTTRIVTGIVLSGASLIWAFIGFMSLWKHIQGFMSWKPGP